MSDFKILPVRFEPETYRLLRKMAYLNEMPMSELIRDLVKNKINEYKKVLTNSDVAI